MKIVYLHQYFHTPEMSGGTRSYEMARRLVRSGHEVHLVTSDTAPVGATRSWRETTEAGIHVHWLPVPYSNEMAFSDRMRAFQRFAWHSASRAAALKGDVVFATSTPLTIAVPGIWASLRSRAPLVFEVRDLWPELPIAMGALRNPLSIAAARTLEWLAYHASAHIVALSPGMRDGVVRRGIDPQRVSVIPNSCDIDLFDVPDSEGKAFRSQQPWLQDRPLVVYCGTLGRINGVEYLVRLAAAVQSTHPDIRFLVIGSGSEEAAVRRLAGELGVLDRNFFLWNRVPKRDVPRILSAATLAISVVIDLPELWANSANKLFDALAAGRPVAINHEGWLADLIREQNLGLVLDARSIHAAARSLVACLENEHTLQAMRRSAQQAAREHFSRDALARQLEDVLVSVLERSNRATGDRSSLRARSHQPGTLKRAA
jgi:glycosyltransferase involved in cell wall biosynthesis